MLRRTLVSGILLSAIFLVQCSKDAQISEPVIDKTLNLKGTGDSANDMLSNSNYSRMLIEVVYVNGFRPDATSIDNITDFLKNHTFKTDIEINYTAMASPGEETLTLQEIADLETANRTAYNTGNTVAVYIYFADAPSSEDDPDADTVTLGAVYRNTSMVIHGSTIRDLSRRSAQITVSDVESATLMHEFGHLLGLVNIGSPMVNPHEDSAAPNHCTEDGCLMAAELQFGSGIMGLLESRSAKGLAELPALGPECLLDLQNNGGR